MNKYIIIFSIVSFFCTGIAKAEEAVEFVSAVDDPSIQETVVVGEVDNVGFNKVTTNVETSSSAGSIYVNKDHTPISSSNGPILKAPSNTFPLSRSGMMVSPTPMSNAQQPKISENNTAKVDKETSLTEIFDEKAGKDSSSSDANKKDGETWLDRLRSSAESEIKGEDKKTDSTAKKSVEADTEDTTGLKSLVDSTKTENRRSNAAVFDIAGAMLRMTPKQVDEILTRRGYRKNNERFEIPNFIKWRKEDECRASGVVGYERLANCVVQASKAENYQYLEMASYAKYDTQESISIQYTSNFTGNKAFKISYTSTAANITGNSQKAIYMRNIKIYDFWKQISQKYGSPDNKDDVIWGLGGNKPYMQARTGRLLLEDPMLRELDYTRMSREDQRFINTGIYNF